MSATGWAWVVLLAPLAGTLLLAFSSQRLPDKLAGALGTLAIAVSFAAAVLCLLKLHAEPEDHRQLTSTAWDYARTVGVDARLTLLVDPLSVLMILVVSGVSTLIHLYSVSYMESDRGYVRFFAYLNFFVFSMLLLVLAGNFLVLIVGWAFVGAASYLLISFWFRRPTATRAGIKAFVINVVGDIGLVLGTYFIFRGTHTLDFLATFRVAGDAFYENDPSLVAGCVLLLVGAFAKSAQIPLHTWLPDAMEGPTPVSALIHAATMVTAGVYLIARMHPLFELAPTAADVGAIIGCATLLVAATIGLAVTDLKRVIAYSTMSQIGYMIMGVSSGAYAAGMFHLMTHAFFKALLFMAAGSVIAAMAGVQNMDRMGGFRKAQPFTYACFIVGGLALSGVPPFSGFFSKDEILLGEAQRGGWHWALYGIGYFAAGLTAIYTFRMIFRAFHGEPVPEARELEQGHLHHEESLQNESTGEQEDPDVGFPGLEHHIAERSLAMKVAMGLLAIGAIGAGALQIPTVTDIVDTFLEPTFKDSRYLELTSGAPGNRIVLGLALGAGVGLLGILVAYRLYLAKPGGATRVRERFPLLHRIFFRRWYFDEILDVLVVKPFAGFGRLSQAVLERVFVNGLFVGGSTGAVRAGSAAVRAAQTGFLRYYAALLLFGLAGVALYFLLQSS